MKTLRTNRIRGTAGFTLVELLVVIVITAILAMVAIPSYQTQIRKSRRTDAKAALLDLASREERYSSTHNAYTDVPGNLGYAGAAFPVAVGSGYYNVGVKLDATTGYIGTATAVGSQTKDTLCANYTLDGTGLQSVSGTDTVANCWN